MSNRISALVAAACMISAPSVAANGQTLQQFSAAQQGQAHLTIFADGGVKQVVSQPADATTTTGSLGMTYQGTHFIVSSVVNVLAHGDTITKGYGASMLPPAAGAAQNSALLDVRYATFFRDLLPKLGAPCSGALGYLCDHAGLHGYASASANVWQITPASGSTAANVQNVPVHALGFGTYYTFFDTKLNDTPAAMGLDITGVTRSIRGDLTIPGAANDSLRAPLLGGTKATNFGGYSIGINMQYDIVNAGLTYYHMAGSVPGFSHGQIVAGISLRAKLNGGDVR